MNIQTKGLRIENLKRETWKDLFFITITLTLVSSVGHASTIKPVKIISPLAHQVYASDTVASNKPSIPTLNPNIGEREQNMGLIRKIWGKDSSIGLAIARCESGYRSGGDHVANTNETVDQGVFSINSVHGMPEMENPVANISYAYSMYLKQGTNPWNSSRACWEGNNE